jgi:hypothetical protein
MVTSRALATPVQSTRRSFETISASKLFLWLKMKTAAMRPEVSSP